MKQIKEETENFRKFRQEKEKEVTQLKAKVTNSLNYQIIQLSYFIVNNLCKYSSVKYILFIDQDRRRQAEFIKLERQHERQQAVLRRKAEQAAAANKRLKEALAKQQNVAEERAKAQERQAGTMQERIKVQPVPYDLCKRYPAKLQRNVSHIYCAGILTI